MNKPDIITKILSGIIVALLGLSLYQDFAVAFWGDQDWELLVSTMWLQCKKLYVDHVPVTGPLLFYLYAPAVLLSEYVPFLQDYQALVLLSLLAIALIIFLCTRLTATHLGFTSRSLQLQWIMLLCFLLIIRIAPAIFADREHIFIVLTLPYLLRFMPGLSNITFSLRLRLVIGAVAAVGFFIKPHCLLLFAGIQIITIIYTRSLRILYSLENSIIYALGILYLVVIWLYTPEYLTLVLPFAYFTYSANQNAPIGLFSYALCVVLAFIMLRPDERSVYRKDIYYFTALLPFLCLYVLANNGWIYTYQPFLTIVFLINGFALWEFLTRVPGLTRSGWKPLVGSLLCTVNFALQIMYAAHYMVAVHTHPCHGDQVCPGYYQPFMEELQTQHAHSFGAIGMDFGLWARVSKLSGAEWKTRFPQLWMLPKFIISGEDFYKAHKSIFFYAADALAEDIEQKKPELIFVELRQTLYSISLGNTIDWVEMFRTSPSFKHAWERYTFVHTIDDCMLLPPQTAVITRTPAMGETSTELNCRFDVYRRLP